MKRPLQLTLVVAVTALLALPSAAQIRGTPPSVTSFGPGRGMTPGVPASITSLGPLGFNQFHHGFGNGFGHGFGRNPRFPRFIGGGFGIAVPIAVPVYVSPYYPLTMTYGDPANTEEADDNVTPGPTVFERRPVGSYPRDRALRAYDDTGIEAREAPRESSYADQGTQPRPASSQPAQPQPESVLVFRDGHRQEVSNYAIVGDTLYDLSSGRPHKIALADLDLTATAKENDDRGIDFKVPAASKAN